MSDSEPFIRRTRQREESLELLDVNRVPNLQLLPTSGDVPNGPTAAAKTGTATEHMAAAVPKINLSTGRKVGEATGEEEEEEENPTKSNATHCTTRYRTHVCPPKPYHQSRKMKHKKQTTVKFSSTHDLFNKPEP